MSNITIIKDGYSPQSTDGQPVAVLFASRWSRRDYAPGIVDVLPDVPDFDREWFRFCNQVPQEVWGRLDQVGIFEGRRITVNGATFMMGTFRRLTAEEAPSVHLPLREWHQWRPVTWKSVAKFFISFVRRPGWPVWFEGADGSIKVLEAEVEDGDQIFFSTSGLTYRVDVEDGRGVITSEGESYRQEFTRHSDLASAILGIASDRSTILNAMGPK